MNKTEKSYHSVRESSSATRSARDTQRRGAQADRLKMSARSERSGGEASGAEPAPPPSASRSVAAGAFAGVVGTVLGFPFDTVKARMQAMEASNRTGALKCTSDILRREGALAFYRGMASPLTSLVILNSLNFGFYAKTTQWTKSQAALAGSSVQPFVAGGMVGVCAGVISTPFEMTKVRMQLDNQHGRVYKKLPDACFISCSFSFLFFLFLFLLLLPLADSIECARQLVQQHGMRVLYTGYAVNVIREVVFLSIYFGLYEHAKRALSSSSSSSSSSSASCAASSLSAAAAIAAAGALSGATAWFLSFPLDCIKTRIQGMPSADLARRIEGRPLPRTGPYSAVRVARLMFASHGLSAFYSGVIPSVLRACIVSGSRFSAYELALRVLPT
eukprot:TRINITY_DN4759_c0_g1_i3.p1 TRINITY_DN4759_c0_g1~~TRINITY_DN4759_c0_g1_i3.p1  ORF type:complete len:389 (-),score=91.20 TRINITY_DN4759_c0_g1_i3:50-1216(-)